MSVKQLAETALYTALLISVQLLFSGISSIELVTPLFLVFCYVKEKAGYLLGILFAMVRCLLFGFSPAVVLLYLLYYPAFCYGILLYKKHPALVSRILFALAPALFGFLGLITGSGPGLLLALLAVELILLLAEKVLHRSASAIQLGQLAFCFTIGFSLLDDLITPALYLFPGYLWLAYFQASLPVALIQSILAWISTTLLAVPLLSVLQRISPKEET